MTDVFDLDALEAEGKPFVFRHNGVDYELPADVDLATVATIDRGDFEGALDRLLGAEVWEGIKTSGKSFGIKKLVSLFDAYSKHLGMSSLGGSSASAASS